MSSIPERDPRERFTDRVDDYARSRPGYPPEVITVLGGELRRSSPWQIADVGSGTGLLTRVLLDAGHDVYGVEPNAAMRAAAEAALQGYPRFVSIAGAAEATTLPDGCVDLITAGQAFHWFELQATRREFARILRPAGLIAAIWNTRRTDDPLGAAYEQLLTRFGTDYQQVGQRHRRTAELLPEFFGHRGVRRYVVPNMQSLDRTGLHGRLCSSSYLPKAGQPGFEQMMAELDRLFDAYQTDGRVVLTYDTEIYVGRFV